MSAENPLVPEPGTKRNENPPIETPPGPVPTARMPGRNMPGSILPAERHGLNRSDLERMRSSLDDSVSDNTRTTYNSAWRSFARWADNRALDKMPAPPPVIAAYITYLAQERQLSVATVRLHRAAIAAAHRRAGHTDPTENEGIKLIMQGIARSHGRRQKQARPLTAEAMAAVRATARLPRPFGGRGKGRESPETAARRAAVDLAILSVLRDGLLRRSEAASLTWEDLDLNENAGSTIRLKRSKTDQEAEGTTLYIGRQTADSLRAIRPEGETPQSPVFGLTAQQIGKRVKAAAQAAGLGDGFTGHSGRVGMAQDLVRSGVELPALMQAGRWKSSAMPARYTERQAAARGAVARYYQEEA